MTDEIWVRMAEIRAKMAEIRAKMAENDRWLKRHLARKEKQ